MNTNATDLPVYKHGKLVAQARNAMVAGSIRAPDCLAAAKLSTDGKFSPPDCNGARCPTERVFWELRRLPADTQRL